MNAIVAGWGREFPARSSAPVNTRTAYWLRYAIGAAVATSRVASFGHRKSQKDAPPVIASASSTLVWFIASEKMIVILAFRLTFRCPSKGEVDTIPGGVVSGWVATVKLQVSFCPPFNGFPAPSRASPPARLTVYCAPYAKAEDGRK